MRSKSLRAYKKPDLKELIGNWNHGTEIHICGLLGVVAVLLVWVNLSTLSGEPRTGGEPNMEPQEIPVELGLTADFHRGMSPAVRHNLYSENSMENRIKGRFVPGVSGNPRGRPKGTLRCEIKRLMEQDSPEVLREGRAVPHVSGSFRPNARQARAERSSASDQRGLRALRWRHSSGSRPNRPPRPTSHSSKLG